VSNEIEIRIKGVDDGSTGGVFKKAGKDADDFARDTKTKFSKLGADLGDNVDKGGRGGFSKLAAGAGAIGAKIGGLLGDSMGGALKSDPKLVAGISAAIVSGGPIIGAALSSAILGGAGIGAVAGGIALIKDDPRIKAAGKGLSDNLLGDLRDSASVMTGPLLASIEKISGRVDGLGGDFDRIFGRAAEFVEPLTDGVLRAADAISGGLADALDGAGPVIDTIADSVGDFGEAIGDGLSALKDNGPAAAEALGGLLKVAEMGLRAAFGVTDFLTDQYRNLSYGIHMLMGDQEGANALFETAAPLANDVASAYQDSEEAAKEWADAQNELNEALYGASNANRDAITAALDYKDAVKDAKDSVDGLTGASEKEMRALVDVASEADALSTALANSGASTEEMSNAVKQGRADVFNLGLSMGLSREKAQELANRLVTMPKTVNTDVNVNTGTARTRLQEVQYLLGSIRSKTITVDVIESIYRQDDALARRANGRAHGGISGAETGGARGGLTWVGERGPELVKLPFGSTVYPAGQSQAMAAAGGGGGGVTVELRSSSSGRDPFSVLVDALIPYIQANVRTRGGGDVGYLAGAGNL
jgi:hypothetical protein